MFFRKLKIRTKLFLVIGAFLILFLIIGGVSFFSLREATSSFSLIQQISFPQIIVSNSLRYRMNLALLSAYDYVATGNPDSKTEYEERFSDVFLLQIQLFEIAQTEEQFQVSQDLNGAVFLVKDKSDKLIEEFETGGVNSDLRSEFEELSAQLDIFTAFLLDDIQAPILDRADEASAEIEQRVWVVNITIVASAVLVLIVMIISVVFIRSSVTVPLNVLVEAAKRFAKGEFYEVKTKNRDELGVFAETFTVMGQDIKAATQALEIELEKTKKLDAQKSEFLLVAAHQLRTPTSGIRWLFQALIDGDLGELTEDQVTQLGKGLVNADRMVRVINDLLEATRVGSPRYSYDFAEVQPADLVKKVAGEFDQNAQAKNVTLHLDAPDMPKIAQLDGEKFELLVTNILDNAIKYNKDGGNTWVNLFPIDDDHFQLVIKDEGLGIPKDEQDQMFKKFFRAKNVVQIDTMGSGLGLSMVKDVVTNHEGTITFESAENQGTTFWVTLPYVQKPVEGAEAPTLKTMAKKLEDGPVEEKAS